ncbi:MAG: tetratricopeptide repeat protein [Blastocatellia bacterium]|nr:tetratricopeptide repeat protein [Blastocatellia bacterium]
MNYYQKLTRVSVLGLFLAQTLMVFAARAASIEQPVQQTRAASTEKEDKGDLRSLEPGKPVKRELAGGQQHSYQIRLSADQFLKVIVEQQGIDVVVQVSGPDGKQILEFDSEILPEGQEEVSLVAEAAGEYRLAVSPKLKEAPAGGYEIRIEELRVSTDTDRALHDGRKEYEESVKLRDEGKYDKALPLAKRALEIHERVLGAEHRDVAEATDNLARIYLGGGEYVKAEPLYRRALAIREKVLGKDHPYTASSLINLAGFYRAQGKYEEAELLCKRALDIYEKALGQDHPDTAVSLDDLAVLYREHGKYSEAEPLYKRALDIREKVLGKDHSETAVSLNNLAALYVEQGKYAEAEPLFKRVVDIWEKTLGKDHQYTIISLNNLALLYARQGKYGDAEPLLKHVLEVREKTLGKDNPDTALYLNNLAALYRDQGRYAEAEPLYKRALDIREKALSKDHPYIAQSLNNLATLFGAQGKYSEAEQLLRRTLEIWEKALGKDHPNTAVSLDNLALLYIWQGRYGDAEPLLKSALEIREKVLGKDHPDTARSLASLALLYTAKGDTVQAVKFQLRADIAGESNITHNLISGSERQKLAFLAHLSEQTDRTISLHLRSAPADPVARDLAATMILQRKGRALDVTSQNLNALRARFNAEDQSLLDRLTETRSQLARFVLRGPQKMAAEQYQAHIKELEVQAEKDEAEISSRNDEFRAQSQPVTLEAVRAAIPPAAALIEFTTYRPFNAKVAKADEAYGPPHYAAYVIRHEGNIKGIELGDAMVIDKAISSLRRALRDPNRTDVKRLARVVDAKVFQPIRPLLGDLRRLLISPDGSLNLIPFAALVDERGKYALERFSISSLTSGRDLLRLQVPRKYKTGPLVVAAPDFGRRGNIEALALRKPKTESSERGIRIVSSQSSEKRLKEESSRAAIDEIYFPPLPNAAREGEALGALFPDATLLTKQQANKSALTQVHAPKLLHIATHGFFLEDQQLNTSNGRGAQALLDDPQRALQQLEGIRIENPLLRSGLALAGANLHKEDDNGILTALEMTGLNLWGTKLVVLSACDTGVGEVKNGDGVYGLRRALVLAGAETQVMSLWAVSDKATRELMVSYYSRLQEGQGRGEALRQVQLEMLKNVNRRHPYYWASFIQSGEWANLAGKR